MGSRELIALLLESSQIVNLISVPNRIQNIGVCLLCESIDCVLAMVYGHILVYIIWAI